MSSAVLKILKSPQSIVNVEEEKIEAPLSDLSCKNSVQSLDWRFRSSVSPMGESRCAFTTRI